MSGFALADELSEPGELAEKLSAECVIVIGRKAVLYRKSGRKDVEHIALD